MTSRRFRLSHMSSALSLSLNLTLSCASAASLATFLAVTLSALPAHAQQLAATVNGDPITSYDVDQRIRLLRVLKQPAGRQDAIESLIADRLKLREMAKYQITASEQDILIQGGRDAARAKITPQQLGAGLQSARIDESHWKDHFKAEHVWNSYIGALNKTVEVSEADVQAALAKRGKGTSVTEYVLRQVILVVPLNAGAGAYDGRMREASGLRARFTDCQSGQALARAMNEVAVKEPISRNSNGMNDKLKDMLDHTEIGHLTTPERGPNGLEMIAVCERKSIKDDQTAGADIRSELLYQRLEGASEKAYKEMRSHALVVVK